MHYTKTTLENGLRVILVPNAEALATTVLVMAETGSKYETKKTNGLAHFFEHMVFKGTIIRPKASHISQELDGIGAQYNAFTSQEYTGYYAKVASRYFDQALDIVSDMYTHPLFEQTEIEKEKGVIVEEIRMYQDMPHHHVQNLFMELLYGDTPAGWNIAGTETTVKSFTREDFLTYRQKQYTTAASIVVISGNFDETTILAKVQDKFKDIKNGKKSDKEKVIENQIEPKAFIQNKKTDQTHIVLGVRGLAINDTKTPVARVLAGVLGGGMSSRLFQKLRDEMGVGYYVHASHDPYTDHGVFSVSTGVDTTRVDEVVRAILRECTRLKEELVPEIELDKVKNNIIGTLELGLETSDAQGEFLAFQEIVKGSIESPEEIHKKILAVTAEDVLMLAQTLFIDTHLNIALVGNYPDESKLKSLLKF